MYIVLYSFDGVSARKYTPQQLIECDKNERWKVIKIFSLGFHGNVTSIFSTIFYLSYFQRPKIENGTFHYHKNALKRLQLKWISSVCWFRIIRKRCSFIPQTIKLNGDILYWIELKYQYILNITILNLRLSLNWNRPFLIFFENQIVILDF